jgi:hypothetical protein
MRVAPALLRAALGAVLLALVSHTRADPDLWGHVLFGADTIAHRALERVDRYSFLSDRPWINHEWLAEVAMGAAYRAGGGAGLVALKLGLLLAMAAGIWTALRRRGLHGRALDLLLALALIGVFPQINHVRPQVFSLVLFAWMLVALTAEPRGASRARLAVPLVFVAWVNLHGGWIVGGGVLALWTACTFARPAATGEAVRLGAIGALALAGTLVNPYGWGMWRFLWTTVGFGRADVVDWQPVFRLGPAYVAIWLVLAAAAAAAIPRALGSTAGLRSVAVVAALGIAAFRVNRLLAFFAIALVILLGREIGEAIRRERPGGAAEARPRGYAVAASVAVALALIAGGLVAAGRNVTCVAMDAAYLPEPEVAHLAGSRSLKGRLLVWFDWGEYAIWHMGPDLRVSIDGRRETVYADEVVQRHLQFYFVPSTRAGFLREVRPDYIWLPRHLPDIGGLEAAGWRPVFEGPRSVFLARDSVAGPVAAHPPPGRRCFPGP